jgi:hypothetical protein
MGSPAGQADRLIDTTMGGSATATMWTIEKIVLKRKD